MIFTTGVWDAFDTVLTNINILKTPSGTDLGNTILIVFIALSVSFLVSRKVDDVKIMVVVFFFISSIMGNPILTSLLFALAVGTVFFIGIQVTAKTYQTVASILSKPEQPKTEYTSVFNRLFGVKK